MELAEASRDTPCRRSRCIWAVLVGVRRCGSRACLGVSLLQGWDSVSCSPEGKNQQEQRVLGTACAFPSFYSSACKGPQWGGGQA